MELTKNYEPKKNINKIKKDPVDFLFPIFLPSYRKVTWKNLTWYLNQSIAWKARSQKLGKSILPCFIRNVDTLWDSLILENKNELIFPAKLQRLYDHKNKTYKKILPVLSQIFAQSHFDNIYNFSLSDQKNLEILNKFQEKWLWKEKEKLVYWDISTQSIVEEDAIDWREEEWTRLTIKCFVETKNDVFLLVVDDPTILFSDVAVIVHANDKRYKKHIGKNIIFPIINKPIPILSSSTIDTIKDNGILRVNPLLNEESLEKVKELWLSTTEDFVDNHWLFIDKVANFWWKSVFEFTENVIETLSTIGNLEKQEKIIQKVPYSKATGQRLIKKVIPMLVLDFSWLKEEFDAWFDEHFYDYKDSITTDSYEILLETKNPFNQKLSLVEDETWTFTLFKLLNYDSWSSFSLLLLNWLKKQHLNWNFSINELIDLIFLLTEEEWDDFKNQINWNREDLDTLRLKTISKNWMEIVEDLYAELEKIPWIDQVSDKNFSFNIQKLLGDGKKLWCISCADTFLQALALIQISTSQFVFDIDELSPQTIKNFFFFLFLSNWTQCSIFPHEEWKNINLNYPEKFSKYSETYWWETLRLFTIQNEKFDEIKLQETFWYLKHLWNLFKILYENWAYPNDYPSNYEIDWKGNYALWKRNDIKSKLESFTITSDKYSEAIKELQHYTREHFTRYFTLLKQEKKDSDNWLILAGQIFMDILIHLEPIIPEFVIMVEQVLWRPVEAPLINQFHSEVKDYKINLVFDIFYSIFQEKNALWLKKHVPIDFFIQANPSIIEVLESYKPSLEFLFKIKEFKFIRSNENYPSWYKTFSILDITLWIKAHEQEKKESTLDELEREFKSKKETADYLRSMLMALSSMPLTPSEKIEEKQKELDTIMSDIQYLEIKIQKAKMEKKA